MKKYIIEGKRAIARSKTSLLIKTDVAFDNSIDLKDLAFWFPNKMSKFIGKNEKGVHLLKLWAPDDFEFTTIKYKLSERGSKPVGNFKLEELLINTEEGEVK